MEKPGGDAVEQQAVERNGQRQAEQGAGQVSAKTQAGHRQCVIQDRHGLKEDAQQDDAVQRALIELKENPPGQRTLQLAQGIAADQANGQKSAYAGNARGDIGHYAAPTFAQRQDSRRKKDPAGYLNQVADDKKQHEKQQAVDLVGENLLLQKGQAEIAAQAGKFQHGKEQGDEGGDGEQLPVGAGGNHW